MTDIQSRMMALSQRVKTRSYEMAHELQELSRELNQVDKKLNAGMKDDAEKPMYNLLPPNAIDSMARVMTFGAKKYAPNSWQLVDNPIARYQAALLRHAFAMLRGEVIDSDSGLPHSAHVMCCAAFINELETLPTTAAR